MVQADGASTDADFVGVRDRVRVVACDLKTGCVGRTVGAWLDGQKAGDELVPLGERESCASGGRGHGIHFDCWYVVRRVDDEL